MTPDASVTTSPSATSPTSGAQATDDIDPRVARSRAAVLGAARTLLVDGGPGAVTVDAVVAASGVAKTTIYRHWPSQRELLVAVMRDCAPALDELVAAAHDDDFETALRRVVASVAAMFSDESWVRVLPGMIALKRELHDLEEFQNELEQRNKDAIGAVLAKGIAEGRVRPDIDAELTGLYLGGPFLMAALLDGRVPAGLGDEIVDRFLASEAAFLAAADVRQRA